MEAAAEKSQSATVLDLQAWSEGSTARTDPEDRGGRGPPSEQWKCKGGVPSPLGGN